MSQAQGQSFPHYFSGYVQEGKIYAQSYEGTQHVGMSIPAYNELQAKHDELVKSYNEYQQILIEKGLIEVPLTPEEMIKKQAEQMQQLQRLMLQMSDRIESLAGASDERIIPYPKRSREEFEVAGTDERGIPDSPGDAEGSGRAAAVYKPKPAKNK